MFSIIFQLLQLDLQSAQSVESVKTLYVMKSRPLKDDPSNSLLKAKVVDGQQREDMFHEVRPSSQTPPTNIKAAQFFRRDEILHLHFSQIETESVKKNYV